MEILRTSHETLDANGSNLLQHQKLVSQLKCSEIADLEVKSVLVQNWF
jgi:hypothetical protein